MVSLFTKLNIISNPLRHVVAQSIVDGIDCSIFRDADVWVGEDVFSQRRFKCETIYAITGSKYQYGRRPIKNIAGSYLLITFLKNIGLFNRTSYFTLSFEDTKY